MTRKLILLLLPCFLYINASQSPLKITMEPLEATQQEVATPQCRKQYTIHQLHLIKQAMDYEKYQEIMERRKIKKLVKYKPISMQDKK